MTIFSTCAFSTAMNDWAEYVTDSMQRSILFWDVMRKRGNIMIEHYEQGKPPLLAFEHEMVLDGRTLERPANYALLRILPRPDQRIDPDQTALHHRRSQGGARAGDRRLQGGQSGRLRPPVRPSLLFHHLLPRTRAGPDAGDVASPKRASSSGCASFIPTATSPASTAIARPAGRSRS